MRVRQGYCLDHVKRLMRLDAPCPYVVCMGPRGVVPGCELLHCWLEAGETVVDLTTAQRFFSKSEYYSQQRINVGEVRRFTAKQAARLLLDEGIAFWGFDLKRYASVSAWPPG
jgi:hypothetical protein